MRWPLRNQITLPMLFLMLGTLAAVSVLNAYVSVQRTRDRIERELDDVARTLADSSFPLTDGVLRKMRGLAGTEFVMLDSSGKLIASSAPESLFQGLKSQPTPTGDALGMGIPVGLEGGRYYHTTLKLRRGRSSSQPDTLHILYPEESYRAAWRDAAYPPLLAGTAAIVLVVAFAIGIASRVTRPLRRLQMQVGEIAGGDFKPIPLPRRDDEITDLSRSINQMAEMLAKYESGVRQNERLRTLGQLGAGIAHQMRNSATGCRIAIELHARECNQQDNESLDVARRQLELMESYLQRFLRLGHNNPTQSTQVNLTDIVGNAVSLVRPMARHKGVQLEWSASDNAVSILGDADSLGQMLVNLLVNAIEAASIASTESSPAKSIKNAIVTLRRDGDRVEIDVCDTGVGPPAEIVETLFEPFTTSKPDGVGLGLSVSSEIATAHRGAIRWRRRDEMTCFTVELPAVAAAELADQSAVPAKSGV